MVVSTALGGIFMVAVQSAAQDTRVMESSDSLTFFALLGLLMVFGGVPSAALATIFAQQAAAAVTEEKAADMTATTRAILKATLYFSLVVAGVAMVFAQPISAALGVHDPNALRVTMLAVLPVISLPTFKGLLQGLHRFAPLGWLQIMEGFLRLSVFLLLVMVLKGRAVGGVWAICAGQFVTTAAAVWWTRDVLRAKSSGYFSWKTWLIRGAPLTMALGAYTLMTCLDRVFIKSLFFDTIPVKLYNNAMLVGFAIGQFISPVTTVMFPTIVRNLALSKKSDALTLTVLTTGIFAALSAVGFTLFPRLPLLVLHLKMEAAPLVPWFAWAILPLAMAYVLIQNLMARERYAAALWLIFVPVVYGLTLMAISPLLVSLADVNTQAHGVTNPETLRELMRVADFKAMTRVIQTLGFFCMALFGVVALFSWRATVTSTSGQGLAAGR